MTFRFDLTDLRLFLHVVEAGSITAGADRAHLALASASARIAGMEDTLGTPLFTRERRGVHPTPAGRALIGHARAILLQTERMRGELGEYAKGLKGQIRILCNTVAMSEYLPAALGDFLSAHPNVDVNVKERQGFEIVQGVLEGTADVGIAAEPLDFAGLETFPFRMDRLVLAVPRDHPLAGGGKTKSVAIAKSDGYDVVGLPEGTALQEEFDAAAERRGHRHSYRVRLPTFDGLGKLVARGVGIALMPESAARRHTRGGAARILQLTDAKFHRRLHICVREFAGLPAYTKRLVERLRTHA